MVTVEVLIDVFVDVATDIAIKAVASKLGYYFRDLDIN